MAKRLVTMMNSYIIYLRSPMRSPRERAHISAEWKALWKSLYLENSLQSRPSFSMLVEHFSTGQVLSIFEHRNTVNGIIWRINVSASEAWNFEVYSSRNFAHSLKGNSQKAHARKYLINLLRLFWTSTLNFNGIMGFLNMDFLVGCHLLDVTSHVLEFFSMLGIFSRDTENMRGSGSLHSYW